MNQPYDFGGLFHINTFLSDNAPRVGSTQLILDTALFENDRSTTRSITL